MQKTHKKRFDSSKDGSTSRTRKSLHRPNLHIRDGWITVPCLCTPLLFLLSLLVSAAACVIPAAQVSGEPELIVAVMKKMDLCHASSDYIDQQRV